MTKPTTIHLLKPHRHAGRNYPAGAELTLPQRKAAWLIGIGVATASRPAHLADMSISSARRARKTEETAQETEPASENTSFGASQ